MDSDILHGVEIKTLLPQEKAEDGEPIITTKGHARAAKAAWQRENQQNVHTLVLDDRKAYNANGEGQHAPSKRVMYYARGFGTFPLKDMHKVTGGLDEVKTLLATPYAKLPKPAQKHLQRL